MIFFKDKYFISCTTVNPYNEKDDPLEYKRFETYGDFHNFDKLCKAIIYKKYKTWVLETKSNKMTTTKKLLTIKNNFEKDRKGNLLVTELSMGVYEIQETKTLDGLVLNDKKYEIKFEQQDLVTKVYEVKLDISNDTT